MLGDRNIVFLSSVEWDRLWQGHHELASRLAAEGNRVLYVENIGVRAPRWEDRSRVADRLARWATTVFTGGARQVADRLWVSSPLLMPPFTRSSRSVNRHLMIEALARTCRSLAMSDPILWTYLPTDTARDVIGRLRSPRSLVVYSCLAEFAELVTDRDALAHAEEALLAQCDLVFALPDLVERCARHSERVVPWSPGVNTERFDPWADPSPPAELLHMRRPVIGYVGGLHRHLDVGLLADLIEARPDWTWVFVGPVQSAVDPIARRPNVRLLGELPHAGLPGAVAAFDVGIVPYRLSAYTTSVIPTKVGEYLAMGKPVVSTPIPAAVRLEEASGGAVLVAPPEPAKFLPALDEAVRLGQDAGTAERCRSLAMSWAWSRRIEEMSSAVEASARPS